MRSDEWGVRERLHGERAVERARRYAGKIQKYLVERERGTENWLHVGVLRDNRSTFGTKERKEERGG